MAEVTPLRYQLDSCVLRADPPLDLHYEHMTYPRNLVSSLGLEVYVNDDGIIIAGTCVKLQSVEIVV